MNNYDLIKIKLNEIFCEVFDEKDIKIFDSMTADDLEAWDSVNHITLVLAIEKAFNIRLKAAEVGNLSNVGEMLALLERRS